MREGLIEEAIPALLSERSGASSPDPWTSWRIAWAYNQMDLPDSALAFACEAWRMRPQSELLLSEYMKTLRRLGKTGEVVRLAALLRGGGPARYQAAACGHEPSRAFLEEALNSPDDSTAADAACWLSVLAASEGDSSAHLGLLRQAVALRPGESFYRSMLVEALCDAGLQGEAMENLLALRRERCRDQSYWDAHARVALLEGDTERRVWALRRAWQARRSAAAARNLGWALVSAALEDLREGRPEHSRQRLVEASGLGRGEDGFRAVADSILGELDEFQARARGGRRPVASCGRSLAAPAALAGVR